MDVQWGTVAEGLAGLGTVVVLYQTVRIVRRERDDRLRAEPSRVAAFVEETYSSHRAAGPPQHFARVRILNRSADPIYQCYVFAQARELDGVSVDYLPPGGSVALEMSIVVEASILRLDFSWSDAAGRRWRRSRGELRQVDEPKAIWRHYAARARKRIDQVFRRLRFWRS